MFLRLVCLAARGKLASEIAKLGEEAIDYTEIATWLSKDLIDFYYKETKQKRKSKRLSKVSISNEVCH